MPPRLPGVLFVLTLLATAAGTAAGQTTALTGFVDAAWVHDTSRLNGEFGVDEVELNVRHEASERTLVRADLEWLRRGEDFVVQVEQAYISLLAGRGWTVTFGKFNAPIGFEAVDAPEMHQYSHSLVYDHGLPVNLTGVSVGRDLGRSFDLLVYGCNGWDRETKTDGAMSWGGRFGYAREGFVWGVSAIGGKEEDLVEAAGPNPTFTRTVLDLDLSYAIGRWLFGAEFNRGTVEQRGGQEQHWLGFLLLARREFGERAGLTVRYDDFDDRDGYAFAAVDGRHQRRQALAIAPTYELDDGLSAVLEWRRDWSNRDAFTDRDGRPTSRGTTVALNLTYAF
jgi:hypothetical protein